MTTVDLITTLAGHPLAVLAATVVGLVLLLAVYRMLRRANKDTLLVVVVSVLAVAIGGAAFHTSLRKLADLAGADTLGLVAWLPGLGLEGGLAVATLVELSKNAKGKSAPAMAQLSSVLLVVTMVVNALGEDTIGKMLLHGVMPYVWKRGAIGGLKALLLDLSDKDLDEDRLPALRWFQAPYSTFWCWRMKVLGRVPSYAAALAIDTQVAADAVRMDQEAVEAARVALAEGIEDQTARKAAETALSRAPSARQLALLRALDGPPASEPKRRPTPKATTVPATKTTSSRPAPASPPDRPPAAAFGGTAAGPSEGAEVAVAASSAPLRLTVPADPTETPTNEGSAMRVGALEAGYDQDLDVIETWLAEHELTPTGDNVAEAARAKQLPYARRSAALAVAKELKQRRAAAS